MTEFDMFSSGENPDIEKAEEALKESINLTAGLARECLKAESFYQYKKALEKTKGNMLDYLVSITNRYLDDGNDITHYAARVIASCMSYEKLNVLFKTVTKDSKKSLGEDEDGEG